MYIYHVQRSHTQRGLVRLEEICDLNRPHSSRNRYHLNVTWWKHIICRQKMYTHNIQYYMGNCKRVSDYKSQYIYTLQLFHKSCFKYLVRLCDDYIHVLGLDLMLNLINFRALKNALGYYPALLPILHLLLAAMQCSSVYTECLNPSTHTIISGNQVNGIS